MKNQVSVGSGDRKPLRLPEPTPAASAHSLRLRERICDAVNDANGRIPFDRFMEMALYAPGLGYYVAGTSKFGESGDFVTAPEVSPLFARCLARQCQPVLAGISGGQILEFGAGSGQLAADLLLELELLGPLPERYLILEPSPELRQRQQRTIDQRVPHLRAKLEWLDELPETGFSGVMIANEVLDAMPVNRFQFTGEGWQEAYIVCNGQGLAQEWDGVSTPALLKNLTRLANEVGGFDAGYESEINLRAEPWLQLLSERLEAGLILLIDYGYPRREYYHGQSHQGTLMCHYRHRTHPDPLQLIGLQDISAHVDFTLIAEVGCAADLTLAGYTTQAHFLLGCGLDRLLSASDPDDVDSHTRLIQAAKRLTLPSAMGERFKVLGLTRNWDEPLLGFQLKDMRERL